MKRSLLYLFLLMAFAGSYAQEASPVAKKVDEIVKKYDDTKGIALAIAS